MFCTACSSLCTVSLSLLTAALAEARLASRVAALIVVFEVELEEVEGLASVEVVVVPSRLPFVPLPVVVVVVVVLGRVAGLVVVLGDVVVGAGVLDVLVGVDAGVVLVGVVVVGAYAAAMALAGVLPWSVEAAEAVVPPALPPALDPEPPLELSPSVSSSLARLASADCRVALPCSRVTSALWGSSVASSCPATTC